MSTLGKTTTPTTGSFGYVENYGTVAMQFTTSQSGLYSSVSFCAAAYSGSLKIHGVIWDASGNVLAFGPGVTTSGGTVGGDGDQTWFTDSFSTPVFIAGGTTIYIGWQTDTHTQYVWAYNGNDHSPNAVWNNALYGTTGQGIGSNSVMSPNGAVAAYATYSQAGVWIEPSGTVKAPVAIWCNPAGTVVKAKGVWVSNGSGGVKQIW